MRRKTDNLSRRTRTNVSSRGLGVLGIAVGIAIGMMALSVSAEARETGDKEVAVGLSFMDASEGLPSTGMWRQGIDFYDLNGDGHVDIVAPPPRMAKEGNRMPVVWFGDGKGKWLEKRLQVPFDCDYGDVAAGDFDRDGVADLALAMHGLGMKALKGAGENRYVDFSEGLLPSNEFVSRAIVSADFNHDGIPDIATVAEAQFEAAYPSPKGLLVCLRAGAGWKCHLVGDETAVKGLFADQLIVGDVNGDGNKDIGVASLNHQRELIVWIGDGKGKFRPFNEGLTREHHYLSVAFGDIDKDGKDDLLASVSGIGATAFFGLKAFLSGPDGFKEMSEGLPTKELFLAVAAGDVTGNGIAEIIGGTGEGGVSVFSFKEGRWTRMGVSGLPEKGLKRMYGIYCIDLNGDGRKDIVCNYADGQSDAGGIRVFLNMPSK